MWVWVDFMIFRVLTFLGECVIMRPVRSQGLAGFKDHKHRTVLLYNLRIAIFINVFHNLGILWKT
jgi:hypothetical protein